MLDIPVCAVACKNTFRFLAKAELGKIPLLGYVVRKTYIIVNRADRIGRSRSMEAMQKSLSELISVLIFPEGTRNKTSELLLDFRDGAFRLAVKMQKPVAVLTITGTRRLFYSSGKSFRMRPGKIVAEWSKPIATTGKTEADVPALIEQVRKIMMEHLK